MSEIEPIYIGGDSGFAKWKPWQIEALHKAYWECAQIAGKALGYPWFKDDPDNFPGSTEEDGVCVGVHVPESIVEELAGCHLDLVAQYKALLAEQASPWQSMAEHPAERTPVVLAFKFPDWHSWRYTVAEFVDDPDGWYWVQEYDPGQWVIQDDQNDCLFMWQEIVAPVPQVKQQQGAS